MNGLPCCPPPDAVIQPDPYRLLAVAFCLFLAIAAALILEARYGGR